MIAPVFIVTLALMLALVSAATPLTADVIVQKSTKKAILPKGLQMMQERMFGANTIPNPVMNHMTAFHGKTQEASSASANEKSRSLSTLEVNSENSKKKEMSASAAKKDFKSQWTVFQDDQELAADVGDVLHYNFFPGSESCLGSDIVGRMSYQSGVCVQVPYTQTSFKILAYE